MGPTEEEIYYYDFTHALEREVVYGTMTEKQRYQLHEKCATYQHHGSPRATEHGSRASPFKAPSSSDLLMGSFSSVDTSMKLSAARRAMHWQAAGGEPYKLNPVDPSLESAWFQPLSL
jgi:hypothetical protein